MSEASGIGEDAGAGTETGEGGTDDEAELDAL